MKVLVADYYAASANITDSVLQNIGVYAEFVSSGEDVIDRIKKNNSYDIIITNNILCGKLDGYQTLLELKNIYRQLSIVSLHVVLNFLKGV